MLQKPTREGEQKECPECGGSIKSMNKPYENKPRLSWRNSDGSAHSVRDSTGKWVHVKSKEEADRVKKGDWPKEPEKTDAKKPVSKSDWNKDTPNLKTVWPKFESDNDRVQALYDADELIVAMAVEKTKVQNPGLDSNGNLFGQIVSASSHRIALVNLARAIKESGH